MSSYCEFVGLLNPKTGSVRRHFMSRHTLSQLFEESGFAGLRFRGAGRFPYLWMTMVMSGEKPE